MDSPEWDAITSRLAAPLAGEAIVADLAAIAHLLDASSARFPRWLEVSPLLTGIADKVRPLPLDLAIDEGMEALRQVCRQPHMRLRSEELLVPAGRARRLAPRAPQRLAAHSEDWDRWTLHGLQPRKILARRYEASADVYENRLTTRLIDHLRRYLARRSTQLGSIKAILSDYDELLQRGSWRVRERLAHLLEGVLNKRGTHAEAKEQQEAAERRRRRLEALTRSPLWKGVDRRAAIAPGFHSTNLFRDHPHYRTVAWLWRQWTAEVAQARTTGGTLSQHATYRAFSALVLIRALDALSYKPRQDARPPAPGTALQLAGPGGDLEVWWSLAGSFQLRIDGTTIGTLIPVFRVLDQDSDPERLEQTLDRLAAAALSDDSHNAAPRVVLYPGDRDARGGLPAHLRWRLDSAGHDLPAGSRRVPVGFIPVTPHDLGSVERVIATLRWFLAAALADTYPPVLDCPSRLRPTVLGAAEAWIEAAEKPGQIRLRRPATAQERATLEQALAQRGRELAGKHRGGQGGATGLWQRITAELAKLDALSRCQLCGTAGDPLRNFQAKDDLTFWSTCSQSCAAEWGTQRCGDCGDPYPVMEIAAGKDASRSTAEGVGRHTRGTAERSELLATPCSLAGARARAMVCSRCGSCPETRRPGRASCPRCG